MSTVSAPSSGARNRISLGQLPTIGLLCLIAAAYVPLLWQYTIELWAIPAYRLAPLALIVAAISAWRQARPVNQPAGPQAWWASALPAGVAAALLALAIVAQAPEVAAVSLLVLVLVATVRWNRAQAVARPLGPWILACLVLRPPADIDLLCFHSVAELTTAVAHRTLDALGVLHDIDGSSFTTMAGTFFTGGVGYGVFSPWSAVAMTLAVCVWLRRSVIDTVPMLVAGCGWFLLVDVMRICASVVLGHTLGMVPDRGLASAALDGGALVLMLLLVISTDRVMLLFGKALRLSRPKGMRRSRTSVKPLLVPTTVTVTGLRLDPSGQLIKVVSELPRDSLPQSSWGAPSAVAGGAPRVDRRMAGTLVAIAYGLLCLVQAVWLPTANGAATASSAAVEAAIKSDMPADSAGWRLESPAREPDQPSLPAAAADMPGHVAARWVYRRGNLTFALTVRVHDAAWQDAAVLWVDRGWQLDSPAKPPSEARPAMTSIPYREIRLSKTSEPSYVCLWASSWDPAGKTLSDAPGGGWAAAAIASVEQAEGVWRAARSFGQADVAPRGSPGSRLNIEGSLVSYAPLTADTLAAGRELYCRLIAKLQRGMATGKERRP